MAKVTQMSTSGREELESSLAAAQSRVQELEQQNADMEAALQRAEQAAAAATSECLALQEAAAGIAVADSRRQRLVAMRLAEIKEELRRTKGELRHFRSDARRQELDVLRAESRARTAEEEALQLRSALPERGPIDLEALEAARGRRRAVKYSQMDPKERVRTAGAASSAFSSPSFRAADLP